MPRMDTISQGTLCWGGVEATASTHCIPLMNIYYCRSPPKVGVGDGAGVGGWIKMLRRWFFKDTSKALPSTAVSKWRWAVGDGVGVYFWYRRWHTWWFRAAGRASSTWQQCNKIIRAIRANKNPSNLPRNPDYDSACSLNTKHGWGRTNRVQGLLRQDSGWHITQLITCTCIRTVTDHQNHTSTYKFNLSWSILEKKRPSTGHWQLANEVNKSRRWRCMLMKDCVRGGGNTSSIQQWQQSSVKLTAEFHLTPNNTFQQFSLQETTMWLILIICPI